jgi:hypothetical protein
MKNSLLPLSGKTVQWQLPGRERAALFVNLRVIYVALRL